MGQMLLLSANPKRRRSGKRRSAAQRAATARMLAANRSRRHASNPKRKRSRKYRANPAAPATLHRRRSVRSYASGAARSNSVQLLKTGAIGGAGALGVDVIFGYMGSVLPASAASRINADGTTNLLYYAAKGATAVALGVFGKRIMPAALAEKLAAGSLTVMSYDLMKGLLPASIPVGRVGYMNPAQVMRGTGKIVPLPQRAMNGVGNAGKILQFNNAAAMNGSRQLFSGARQGRGY